MTARPRRSTRACTLFPATPLCRSLEDALFRQFQPADGHAELTDETPTPRDLSDGVQALYRESLVDLARVKQAVDGFLKAGGGSDLPNADRKSTRLKSSH